MGWNASRKVRNKQERTANQNRQPYEEIDGNKVKMRRPGRSVHMLDPWSWEPHTQIAHRSWKRYRKTQYKPKDA